MVLSGISEIETGGPLLGHPRQTVLDGAPPRIHFTVSSHLLTCTPSLPPLPLPSFANGLVQVYPFLSTNKANPGTNLGNLANF